MNSIELAGRTWLQICCMLLWKQWNNSRKEDDEANQWIGFKLVDYLIYLFERL